ncbi:MAG: DUF2974 domain-containing protein [Eubacteriales bacterium]|nr:DUF2974 domain-containing protein [Eubacteriales bacterium]
MANLFDYLDWRGDLKLGRSPFCGVDALVLAELSYLDYSDMVPSPKAGGSISIEEASRLYFQKHPEKDAKIGAIVPARIVDLLRQAAGCPRYAALELSSFVNVIDTKAEEQFSAICVHTDEKTIYVAFRGTDDTIVGWRENFNMFFKAPVPAQLHAAEYLENVGRSFPGKLIVGGHSKGGNLAIWAAAHCSPDITARITVVYNFDGPGFSVDFKNTDGYNTVKGRIRTIVPECSVVGMFLDHEERYMVVKSARKGIMQHDALSWVVLGTRFDYADGLSSEIKRLNDVLASWINNMDNAHREKFTECFFGLLLSTNAATLTDLVSDKKSLLKAVTSADVETRRALLGAFKLLLGESKKSVAMWLKKPPKKTEEHT